MMVVWIAIGGALGAVARYTLQGFVYRWSGADFPYGTLAVNVIGCLALGLIMGLLEERFIVSPVWRAFLTIGILGGFTTFSSFGYETFALLRDGELGLALLNAGGSVTAGIGAVWLGHMLGRIV